MYDYPSQQGARVRAAARMLGKALGMMSMFGRHGVRRPHFERRRGRVDSSTGRSGGVIAVRRGRWRRVLASVAFALTAAVLAHARADVAVGPPADEAWAAPAAPDAHVIVDDYLVGATPEEAARGLQLLRVRAGLPGDLAAGHRDRLDPAPRASPDRRRRKPGGAAAVVAVVEISRSAPQARCATTVFSGSRTPRASRGSG